MTRFRRPSVMGILNVTPDSFSDGGLFGDPETAAAHAGRLVGEGADLIDVGGESTRPGSERVALDEELRRVMPVLERLSGGPVPLSIDTSKAEVARRALAAGAALVNDVTALRGDAGMAEAVAEAGAEVCLVHMQGEPRTMQAAPRYADVVSEVRAFLEERLAFAVAEGIPEERIWLDPGIGFGKTLEHNVDLVRRLGEIAAAHRNVLFGASRKRFLGTLTGRPALGRDAATVAVNVLAFERGASMFRVHDVAPTRDALAVTAATVGASAGTAFVPPPERD